MLRVLLFSLLPSCISEFAHAKILRFCKINSFRECMDLVPHLPTNIFTDSPLQIVCCTAPGPRRPEANAVNRA